MLRINRIGTEAAVDIGEANPEASSVRRQRLVVCSRDGERRREPSARDESEQNPNQYRSEDSNA
jgi:hypothetical protein